MSESLHHQPDKEPDNEILPPYVSPIVRLHVGKAAIDLTYDNTHLYEFRPQYEQDHIYILDTPLPRMIFRNHDQGTADLYDQLDDMWFPKHRAYQPTAQDTAAWLRYQANQIDGDINSLRGGDYE